MGCTCKHTVSNKTVPMFAHPAFVVLYLHKYSSELHDPSFTGKPCISPFCGCARHVIMTCIRRDTLAALERQHWNGFVADAIEDNCIRLLVLCVAPLASITAATFLGILSTKSLQTDCGMASHSFSTHPHSFNIPQVVWLPSRPPLEVLPEVFNGIEVWGLFWT